MCHSNLTDPQFDFDYLLFTCQKYRARIYYSPPNTNFSNQHCAMSRNTSLSDSLLSLSSEFVALVVVHGYDKLPCLADGIWCDVILDSIGEVLQCRDIRCLAAILLHLLTSKVWIAGCILSTKAVKEEK